jgi:hypothetical protein
MVNAGTIDRLNTTKKLSALINQKSPAPQWVVNYGGFDETLPFYTKRKVIVAAYKGELEMGADYEDTKDSFITETAFLNLFTSNSKIMAVLKEKKLERLKGMVGDKMKVIDCQSERCLIANY